MAEVSTKKRGRPKKYPEGYKEYWRKKNGKPKVQPLRADGKPKHFRIRRTKKQIIIAEKKKASAKNNYTEVTKAAERFLAGTTVQSCKFPLFKMSQYITINRIEKAIKDTKESPCGLIVHEYFLKAFGNLDVAVVFSFLLYMEHHCGVNEYPDSYFCILYRHAAQYCGINQHRVSRTVSQMKQAGLIDTKRVGVPAKVHYRINKIVMMELLYEANSPSDYKGQSVLVER